MSDLVPQNGPENKKPVLQGPWKHIRLTRSRYRQGFVMSGIHVQLIKKIEARLFEMGCKAQEEVYIDETETWCEICFSASPEVAGLLARTFPCEENDMPLVCNLDGRVLTGGAALLVKDENCIRQKQDPPSAQPC